MTILNSLKVEEDPVESSYIHNPRGPDVHRDDRTEELSRHSQGSELIQVFRRSR